MKEKRRNDLKTIGSEIVTVYSEARNNRIKKILSIKAFLLINWDDDEYEYNASWSKTSTLYFDPKAYTTFGNEIIDGAVFIFIETPILFGAVKLRPSKKVKRDSSPLFNAPSN